MVVVQELLFMVMVWVPIIFVVELGLDDFEPTFQISFV
jgi:hypothetical protein